MPGGEVITVSSKTRMVVTNSLFGDNLQDTTVTIESSGLSSAFDRLDVIEYPLTVSSSYEDNGATFRIDATVNQGLHHSSSKANGTSTILFSDSIRAVATYNRSTGPDRTAFIEEGISEQNTSLAVNGAMCKSQGISASNGFVTRFSETSQSDQSSI